MNMFVDYYKLIQVHPESETAIIKKMRKFFAMLYHPDIVSDAEKSSSTELMQRVNAAIDLLLDPVKRQAYNAIHPYFTANKNSNSQERPKNSASNGRKQYSSSSTTTDEYAFCDDFSDNLYSYLKADLLFSVAKKAKQQGVFTGFERRQYYNFATRVNNDQAFTYWQKNY